MVTNTTYDTIFLVGRSGAGKGTQAARLTKRLDFFYWEMGGILRKEIERRTLIGLEIAELLKNGVWLSDDYIKRVVESHLIEVPQGKGIIFDGVPRRLPQAKYFTGLLYAQGRNRFVTILLDVPRGDSAERLRHRAEIEHRVDDTDAAINRRLDQFETDAMPAIEYLKIHSDFFVIDGTPGIEEVEKAVDGALGI